MSNPHYRLLFLLLSLGISYGQTSNPPLTYSARTDQSESLSFLGCNSWVSGTYANVNSGCPVANGGIAPNVGGLVGANTVIADPDFYSQIARVTDNNTGTVCGTGAGYHLGSDGNYNLIASDNSKFLISPLQAVGCVFAFDPTTMQSTPSAIHGPQSSCPAGGCTGFKPQAKAIFASTDPNTMWEFDFLNLQLNQLFINSSGPPSS